MSTHANRPAELLPRNGKPVFVLGGKLYELGILVSLLLAWYGAGANRLRIYTEGVGKQPV